VAQQNLRAQQILLIRLFSPGFFKGNIYVLAKHIMLLVEDSNYGKALNEGTELAGNLRFIMKDVTGLTQLTERICLGNLPVTSL
jgi:hypothetical protein